MATLVRLVGISGSLRRGSYNSAVLRAAAALMPADSQLAIESIAEIPLYDGDLEQRGIPAAVTRLKEAITAADGLVLVSPEYNNSIPGVTKNVIDWLSRPPSDSARVFRDRPVALAGASPGGFGTILSQNAWLPVFRTLSVDFWAGGRLMISHADQVVGADGEIADPATRAAIQKFVTGFVAHLRQRQQTRAGTGA